MTTGMNNIHEDIRFIECKCGEWEQFPSDMARHKSQTFDHVEDIDEGEARYMCSCGAVVTSECEWVEVDRV